MNSIHSTTTTTTATGGGGGQYPQLGPFARLIKTLSTHTRLLNHRRARSHIHTHTQSKSGEILECVTAGTVIVIFPVVKYILLQQSIPAGCEGVMFVLDWYEHILLMLLCIYFSV